MSREIKFRVWHKKNKKMLKSVINPYNFRDQESRFILMQFIGLKDKNGKGIYEGDIIQCQRYTGKEFTEVVEDMFEWIKTYGYVIDHGDYEKIEVIGNIYENPKFVETVREGTT